MWLQKGYTTFDPMLTGGGGGGGGEGVNLTPPPPVEISQLLRNRGRYKIFLSRLFTFESYASFKTIFSKSDV